jgi:hypothetical protein
MQCPLQTVGTKMAVSFTNRYNFMGLPISQLQIINFILFSTWFEPKFLGYIFKTILSSKEQSTFQTQNDSLSSFNRADWHVCRKISRTILKNMYSYFGRCYLFMISSRWVLISGRLNFANQPAQIL